MTALSTTWTVIARRAPDTGGHWTKLPTAPLSVIEARRAYDNGTVDMAQRRVVADVYELLVKVRAQRADRTIWFSDRPATGLEVIAEERKAPAPQMNTVRNVGSRRR